ncbi:NUDIX domain-containing protein [Actinomadura macrotermitis]|uniref:Nudix hydrolase domain-containing protein n=1 Tax=Actinomadura macrotermitis TaxID=2585200 RepID=A0A7K0C933_9ACTN|nr:NUDIX domain-containing protein [Actinomadura macrotermitis]MQY09893.1 hypothetical protein [Actinomadura macrotermitis]
MSGIEYTAPEVFTRGVREGWAERETDPTRINWTERLARAAIPFQVINGRPVNPCETTRVRYGRNFLGHWGEQRCADALVTMRTPDRPASVVTPAGARMIAMIERADERGWAIPGGYVDPGESARAAAVRELREETGLVLPGVTWTEDPPRYVPDPRASDESWMVTTLCRADLGTLDRPPALTAADDAKRAVWVRADDYDSLTEVLATLDGFVFGAHVEMLRAALDGGEDR